MKFSNQYFIMISHVLRELSSNVSENGFADLALEKYGSFFNADYCHFACLTPQEHKVEIHYSRGNADQFFKIWRQREEMCITKMPDIATPQSVIPLYYSTKLWEMLSQNNPLFEDLSRYYKRLSIISSVHPATIGLYAIRFDGKDISEEQFSAHLILSPHIIETYYLHLKMTKYRDLNAWLVKELSNNSTVFALTDDTFNIIQSSNGFIKELMRMGLSWSRVVMELIKWRPEQYRFTHATSEVVLRPMGNYPAKLLIMPVCIEKRFYYKIQIQYDRLLISITRREWEIIDLVRRGLSNRLIANELAISEETVKKHLSNLFIKTGVRNRTELAIKHF